MVNKTRGSYLAGDLLTDFS